jgi:hypothetical protein
MRTDLQAKSIIPLRPAEATAPPGKPHPPSRPFPYLKRSLSPAPMRAKFGRAINLVEQATSDDCHPVRHSNKSEHEQPHVELGLTRFCISRIGRIARLKLLKHRHSLHRCIRSGIPRLNPSCP